MSIIEDDDEERQARAEHMLETALKRHSGSEPEGEQARIEAMTAREAVESARRNLRQAITESQELRRKRVRKSAKR